MKYHIIAVLNSIYRFENVKIERKSFWDPIPYTLDPRPYTQKRIQIWAFFAAVLI